MWWDRFQNSVHCFTPAPSCFAHWFPSFLPWGFYLHSKLREQIFPQQGHRLLASKKQWCLSPLICVLPKASVVWLVAGTCWAQHQRSPSKTPYIMSALNYPRPQPVTLLVDSRERVVIFTSLVILRGSLLFNYSRVSEEKREHWRGYYMLWHFKGDYLFFPSIM